MAENAERLGNISADDLRTKQDIRRVVAVLLRSSIVGKLPSSRIASIATLLRVAMALVEGDSPEAKLATQPTMPHIVVKDFARPGGDVERKDAVVVEPTTSTTSSPTPRSFRCPGRDGECAAPLAAGTEVCWRCGSRLTWKSGA